MNKQLYFSDPSCGFAKGIKVDARGGEVLITMDTKRSLPFQDGASPRMWVPEDRIFDPRIAVQHELQHLLTNPNLSEGNAAFLTVMKLLDKPCADALIAIADDIYIGLVRDQSQEADWIKMLKISGVLEDCQATLTVSSMKEGCLFVTGTTCQRSKIFRTIVQLVGEFCLRGDDRHHALASLDKLIRPMVTSHDARGNPKSYSAQMVSLHWNVLRYSCFLLEVNRVTTIGAGETSFEIFYFVGDGMPSLLVDWDTVLFDGEVDRGILNTLKSLFLKHPARYNSPRHVGSPSMSYAASALVDKNSKELKDFTDALRRNKFTHSECLQIVSILVSITALTNISIHGNLNERSGDCASICETLPALWGCEKTCLKDFVGEPGCLMSKEEVSELNLLLRTLATFLYAQLVQFIIKRLNAVSGGDPTARSFHILDFPGFEANPGDTIDSLYCNCANEIMVNRIAQQYMWQYDDLKYRRNPRSPVPVSDSDQVSSGASMLTVMQQVLEPLTPHDIYTCGDAKLLKKCRDKFGVSTSLKSPSRKMSRSLRILHFHHCVEYSTEKWAVQSCSLMPHAARKILATSGCSIIQDFIRMLPEKGTKTFTPTNSKFLQDLAALKHFLESRLLKLVLLVKGPPTFKEEDTKYLQSICTVYHLPSILAGLKEKQCMRLYLPRLMMALNISFRKYFPNEIRGALMDLICRWATEKYSDTPTRIQSLMWVKPSTALAMAFLDNPEDRAELKSLFILTLLQKKLAIVCRALYFCTSLLRFVRRKRFARWVWHLYHLYSKRQLKRFAAVHKLFKKDVFDTDLRSQAFRKWKQSALDNCTASLDPAMFVQDDVSESELSLLQLEAIGKLKLLVRRIKDDVNSDLIVFQRGLEVWLLQVRSTVRHLENEATVEPKIAEVASMPWLRFQYAFTAGTKSRVRPVKAALVLPDPIHLERFFLIDTTHHLFCCTTLEGHKIHLVYIGKVDLQVKHHKIMEGLCVSHQDSVDYIYLILIWREGASKYWELISCDCTRDGRKVEHLQRVPLSFGAGQCALHQVSQNPMVFHVQNSRVGMQPIHLFFFLHENLCMPIPPTAIVQASHKLWLRVVLLDENRALVITRSGELLMAVSSFDKHVCMRGVFIPGIEISTTVEKLGTPANPTGDEWISLCVDRRRDTPMLAVCGSRGQIIELDPFTWTIQTAFAVDAKTKASEERTLEHAMLMAAKQCLVLVSCLTQAMLLVDLDIGALLYTKPLPDPDYL